MFHVWNSDKHTFLMCSLQSLDLSLSHVKDTLRHTSTPAFSVDSELLRYFTGHADAFQILLYGVSSSFVVFQAFFCTTYIPVYSLSWQSVVVHSQNVPEPSQSFLFFDEIYLLQLCVHPDPLVTDFVLPWDTHTQSAVVSFCTITVVSYLEYDLGCHCSVNSYNHVAKWQDEWIYEIIISTEFKRNVRLVSEVCRQDWRLCTFFEFFWGSILMVWWQRDVHFFLFCW